MNTFLIVTISLALIVQAFIGFSFFVSSVEEREKRASIFGAFQFLGMATLPFVFLILAYRGVFDTRSGTNILTGLAVIGAILVFLMVRKSAPNRKALSGTAGLIVGDVSRIDERDIVFARNRTMRPGTKEYEAYYKMKPEYKEFDDARREIGGPLGVVGKINQPTEGPNIAAMMACINICVTLSQPEMVKPKKHPAMGDRLTQMSAEEASIRVKGFAKALGADKVGIAKLDPRWIYSHRGEIFKENWDDWGKQINLDHQYAIVFLEEMSFEMVHAAPHTPTLIESMKNYSKGAVISTQLASFIANLGYSAHANHLRHYETLLVPLAVDAGLGELGRHGYLMSKEFGSRARISAVTTSMPLIPDKPVDIGVEDFCKICKKCAHCCPSNSIPSGEQTESNGLLRWKLDAESCFNYWGKIGTDCDICMRVCPWSHTRTLSHKLIVELTSRNRLARWIFTMLDDVFYGKRPVAGPPPDWAGFMKKREYRDLDSAE